MVLRGPARLSAHAQSETVWSTHRITGWSADKHAVKAVCSGFEHTSDILCSRGYLT
jgi:hypothetical protein